MSNQQPRRVVITGLGLISPLGNTPASFLSALREGRSGVGPLRDIPSGALPIGNAAEAREFTGAIDQFGPLEKDVQRAIRKGQKVMCREIEMGVAAAQLALSDSGLDSARRNRDRTGVVYGCDYIMTLPEEFAAGIERCLDEQRNFDFGKWAERGLPQVNPLWLLKYLPNMPASHIAIYNDLRGPNNSITLREASACAAISEAHSTISRGHVDALVVGATGSRVLAFRAMHASMQEDLAADREDPSTMPRPFAADRDGAVLGEGSAAILMETLEHAEQRGATILGEVVGYGSSTVSPGSGPGYLRRAIANVLRASIRGAEDVPIGHIHAHALGTRLSDAEEASAIAEVFGDPGSPSAPPVVAAKSYFGNLGAGGGMVEVVASLLCFAEDRLFRTLNCDRPADDCPIRLATAETPAGDSFISVNVTPQGQAAAVRVQRYAAS